MPYLSNREIRKAIKQGDLIVNPMVAEDLIGPTSIDLELDSIEEARIWDIEGFKKERSIRGEKPCELRIGRFDYRKFSPKYLIPPPREDPEVERQAVFLRDNEVVVRSGGFLLWQTRQEIGTPSKPKYICFIDGKSTRARTGLLVHLTAPTIHAGWSGRVTLEIANLGPFDFVLHPGDVIAQITIATISSPPTPQGGRSSATLGQRSVLGRPTDKNE